MGHIPGVDDLAERLADAIAALPLADRVGALNRARAALHKVSPFRGEPVDLVLWVPAEQIASNDYNPNKVAPPEMRLLQHSIEADGYTQPIVAHRTAASNDLPEEFEVVDGFHRNRVGKEVPGVRARLAGHLPITLINDTRSARADRIASTIRHNRARGEHVVGHMSEIVRMLYLAGLTDEKIQIELGMQADEVIRLKQITGLAALFADREFSEAWEAER